MRMCSRLGALDGAVRRAVRRLAVDGLARVRAVGQESGHGLAVGERAADVEEHVCVLPKHSAERRWRHWG